MDTESKIESKRNPKLELLEIWEEVLSETSKKEVRK